MFTLLDLLTGSQPLQKRSGETQAFNSDKLEQSLQQAYLAAGRTLESDEASRLVERILEQFTSNAQEPTTDALYDAVCVILTSDANADAAKLYSSFKTPQKPAQKSVQPASSAPAAETASAASAPAKPAASSTPAQFTSSAAPTPVFAGEAHVARRRRLNEERKAMTHKFQVGEYEGYITVGLYDDGQPGEIFLRMNKEGSMLSGLMDCFATAISIGLQYGVPLKVLVKKFANVHFEPNGETQNPDIPYARSIMDYIFRWLALKFLTPEERQSVLGMHVEEGSEFELANVDGAKQSKLV